jgi:pimeloyl-ACP methyl ester carboxylesterase
MTALAEPLRRAGYRIVLFDLPAHGLSEGRSTNLMDCARAAVHVGEHMGPFDAVISHSFGSTVALVAAQGLPPMPGPLQVKRFVFVASPNRLTDVTSAFAAHWGLSGAGRRAFEQRLERIGRRSIKCFSVVRLLKSIPATAFLVHAPDDEEVDFACAKEIMSEVPGCQLQAFDGLGHRNILFASPPARAIAAYLKTPPGAAPPVGRGIDAAPAI